LQQCPELGLVKPENTEVSMIRKIVFRTSHSLQILIIEPIHICVRIPRITRSPIHVSPVHLPEIRDDINVVFRDVGSNIVIQEIGLEN
jgi:hypothetical protein